MRLYRIDDTRWRIGSWIIEFGGRLHWIGFKIDLSRYYFCFAIHYLFGSFYAHVGDDDRVPPTTFECIWQPGSSVLALSLFKRENIFGQRESGYGERWYYLDTLLGPTRLTETVITEAGETEMYMRERAYKVKYEVETSTFKRARWPISRERTAISFTPDRPIPVPGKGENSWDINDDAIYSTWMPFTGSVDDAIKEFARSIYRDRKRFGGSEDWIPMKKGRE